MGRGNADELAGAWESLAGKWESKAMAESLDAHRRSIARSAMEARQHGSVRR